MKIPNPYSLDNLYNQLWSVYGTFHRSAYEITSHDPKCFVPTINIIDQSLKRWADFELQVVGESADLTSAKNDLHSAFEVLISKHLPRVPAVGERCRACNMPLKTLWHDIPLACETCVAPVHVAIDQLVCCSTKRFTPQMLMEKWHNVFTRPVYKF
jgi:hypothetical protein